MARRRTKEQISADKIVKRRLNILGEKIYNEARKTSRVDTRRLQNSINFRVKPDTVLTIAQVFYGKFNFPKGVTSGDKNALLISARKHIKTDINLIVTEITDQLTAGFKK